MPGPRCCILVTGASGLIGSELCGQLVERGHAVIALVHRRHRLLRNDGTMMQPAPYAGMPPELGTLRWVVGDICKSNLGLGREEAIVLANAVDLIVHCAAATRFSSESDLHGRVNIDGTANVIARPSIVVGTSVAHQRLFSEIDWGTESVFQRTCERADEIGLETSMLPEWYDVDDNETLDWLREELVGSFPRFRGGGQATATRAYLATMPEIAR